MYFKHLLNALLLLALLALMGCGDLLGNRKVAKELSTTQFQANCTLDVDQFGKILHENIGSQIRCLGENLNLFIRVVESPRPGYMGRAALEAYLKKNRPEFKPEMIKALKAVYDLNFLITGDDPENISKANVDQLINFALIFNEQASLNFGPIFESKDPVTYARHQNHRERVEVAAMTIVSELRKIYNPNRNGAIHSMNIVDLLNSFTTEENSESIEKVKKILFAKTVLIGGEKEVITHVELERLLLTLHRFTVVALDAVRYKYVKLVQAELVDLLKNDVDVFIDIVINGLMGNRDNVTLLSTNDVKEAAKLFISSDTLDISKFDVLINEAKRIFMGGNVEDVTGLDLKRLLSHAKSLLQTGTMYYKIWERYKIPLESRQPVTIDFSEYISTITDPAQKADVRNFSRIVKKYRFFTGEAMTATYARDRYRNADGVYQVALFEYLITEVARAYGKPSPNETVGGYSLSAPQVFAIVSKFETELIEMGLILPQRAQNIADNISLLGTLFQYQSDNNGLLDVNEATEFFLSLFSATSMASELMDFYKTKMGTDPACNMDEHKRISPQCFRNHFFQGMCENYRGYFPLMFQSLGNPAKCEDLAPVEVSTTFNNTVADEYLKVSVSAARSCNFFTDGAKEEIYFSEGDIMTILMVMMHTETTTLRWDDPQFGGNANNIMDAYEVDTAYSIYSPALDGFLESMPSIVKKFKKQIYQYLIKYEKVPDQKEFKSIWQFVKFLLSFNKKAPATRKTLASVLTAIGEQNKILNPPKDPNFCNYLRDPENIPREPRTSSAPRPVALVGAPDYSSLLEHIKVSGPKEDPTFTSEKEFCFTLFKTQYCL